jgi:EAL domain-containing protein (putative c-di-GMP-specific phosphodiesterase class I)/GGDEF domain-containing protein
MVPPIPGNERDRLAALHRFALLDTPPEPAFDRLTRLAATLLEMPITLISLIDEKRQWVKSRVGSTLTEIPRDQSFCVHAITVEDMLVVEDATQDPRFRGNPLVVGCPHVRFYAGVPLRTTDGLALGTLSVLDSTPRPGLSPSKAQALRDLAALAMDLIEARRTGGDLHPVSGLLNRSRFLKDIDASITDTSNVAPEIAIVVIDAATPNQYADLARTLGQCEADSFEVAFAARITERLPERTELYHLSSARFGCILEASLPGQLQKVLDGLADQMRKPGGRREIPFATSVGVGAAYYPQDGADAAELVRAASSGAQASLTGKKRWCTYSPPFDLASRRASHLLRAIGPALAGEGQLRLVYQPKTDLRTGRCIGAEALLRWTHPTLGQISPSEAIPLVERTALVHALTDWELGAALPEIARLRAAGLAVQISVNVSVLDLEDEHFVARMMILLDRHGVPPQWIEIEVTESALMTDPVRIGRQLSAVRDAGVAIEIDDFGIGYSTLSLLKYIPATYVKIDQLFISRLASNRDDQTIVLSTINLAHELGRLVVAEGIEDAEVYSWLREHDCDIGQGNVISPPLDVSHFEQWLRAGMGPQDGRPADDDGGE